MLTEDKLETYEIVIEPEDSPGAARGLEEDQRGTHQSTGLGGPKIITASLHPTALREGRAVFHRTVATAAD
jgi:hypothetical protein